MKKIYVSIALSALTVGQFSFAQNKSGIEPKNLDKTCKPCDDFYQFADGGWMKNNPIPGDQSIWGSFSLLVKSNQEKLKGLLEDLSTKPQIPGSNEQKLGDFYYTAMDTLKIEKDGYTPIIPMLTKVDGIKNVTDLQNIMAELHTYTVNVGFGFASGQDMKDSKRIIGEMAQGGLSLPDRDYYLGKDSRSQMILTEYKGFIKRLFMLTGVDEKTADNYSSIVISFETDLAKSCLPRVEMRNPAALYHLMPLADIGKVSPNFNWTNYFKNINCPPLTDINVATPNYFKAFDSLMVNRKIEDWKIYFKWRIINESSTLLSSAFENENFNFYKKVLTGQSQNQDRWKRAVQMTDANLGDALGKVYSEKYFNAEAKKRALEMIKNIEIALGEDIKQLDWMSDSTKMMAMAKLKAIEQKIGYPDQWKDYSSLTIDRSSYLMNAWRVSQYEYKRELNKIGKPVDKKEWRMSAPTVNAYYSPTMNEIVFPAGILQPPFFDPNADDAINYGGMGAVIGHEITHGFDDSGCQFDAEGNLKNWWTAKDLENFEGRAKCISNQFGSYTIQDSLHMTGDLVVGESIADLGGLTLAYYAYKNSLKGKPEPPVLDGYTAEQRFFFGWAGVWANNIRPEAERMRIKTDPHPLGRFRVNGTLSNMEAFKKAFGCKDGDKMVNPKEKRCEIW